MVDLQFDKSGMGEYARRSLTYPVACQSVA